MKQFIIYPDFTIVTLDSFDHARKEVNAIIMIGIFTKKIIVFPLHVEVSVVKTKIFVKTRIKTDTKIL